MGILHLDLSNRFEILQNKDKFRTFFLSENGFNVPWAFGFSSLEDALADTDKFSYPLIVKPTDSAGSKGVTQGGQGGGFKGGFGICFQALYQSKIL